MNAIEFQGKLKLFHGCRTMPERRGEQTSPIGLHEWQDLRVQRVQDGKGLDLPGDMPQQNNVKLFIQRMAFIARETAFSLR